MLKANRRYAAIVTAGLAAGMLLAFSARADDPDLLKDAEARRASPPNKRNATSEKAGMIVTKPRALSRPRHSSAFGACCFVWKTIPSLSDAQRSNLASC